MPQTNQTINAKIGTINEIIQCPVTNSITIIIIEVDVIKTDACDVVIINNFI